MREKWLDRLGQWLITLGGLGVIAKVLMLDLYLIYNVAPLFKTAAMSPMASFATPLTEAGESL